MTRIFANGLLILSTFALLLAGLASAHEHPAGGDGAGLVGAHEHPPGRDVPDGDAGVIHFENSGSAAAQAPFIRGLSLLHSFEYAAARKSFEEAGRLDPGFAMAVWGEALTYNHTLWNEQDTAAARSSLAKLGATPEERMARGQTPRERDYLASVEKLYGPGDKSVRNAAYCEALRALSRNYPDDLDARALYALSLLGLSPVRDHAIYMRAAAEAEAVYDVEKRHPGGLHYMIHAYDDPVHAPLGLRAARLYVKVAATPHAQHMTAHIFFALGLWDEAITANEVSLRTARSQGDPNYHAMLWLAYAYLQAGKRAPAADLVRSVAHDVETGATPENRLRLAFARATWLVETRGATDAGAEATVDSTGVTSIGYFAMHDFARGVTAAAAGDLLTARSALGGLRGRIDRVRQRAPDQNRVWYDVLAPNEFAEARALATALDGTIEFYAGRHATGLVRLRQAIAATADWEFEYGPPWSVKPLDELLGELLLADGRFSAAADAFRKTLVSYPNRRLALEGLATARQGR